MLAHETSHFLRDLVEAPDRWYQSLIGFSHQVAMQATFGVRTTLGTKQERDVRGVVEAAMLARPRSPVATIVDMWPALDYLSSKLKWWRSDAERVCQLSVAVWGRELDQVRTRMETAKQEPCLVRDLCKASEHSDEQILAAIHEVMLGCSSIVRIALTHAIGGATIYTDWPRKARKELDAVCGEAGRLPTFEDRHSLPYTMVAVKEALRWKPILDPFGVPVRLDRDEEFEGYHLPAGTVVTWNAQYLATREDENELAHRFWPERHLKDKATLFDPCKGHWAFGVGIQQDVSWPVCEAAVWIAMARLLYCFDFEPIKASSILFPFRSVMNAEFFQDRYVHIDRFDHFDLGKTPLRVRIRPRSPKHAALAEQQNPEGITLGK